MKRLGFFLIVIGLALFIFVVVNLLQQNNKTVSPIPESSGVRVIFITPGK